MSKNISKKINYAFIDSNNLYLGVSGDIFNKDGKKIYSGWKLNYKKFRIYLRDKYKVEKAFLFVGFVAGNQSMHTKLQEDGYICVFKSTLELGTGKVKGNVDAEMVLHSMIQYENYNAAVIVSGDGDFYCLAEYLINQNKFKKILAPNKFSYSSLLNKFSLPNNNVIDFVGPLRNKLEYKK
ncbi:MAG: NYN domain-containing protein [Candidatus Pacebacteria bacterium]|nr:NYN domain-containing protein [Candidatus Paceibacterota bacterium]